MYIDNMRSNANPNVLTSNYSAIKFEIVISRPGMGLKSEIGVKENIGVEKSKFKIQREQNEFRKFMTEI